MTKALWGFFHTAPARSATEKRITPDVPAEAHLNLGVAAGEAIMQEEIWKDVVGCEGYYQVSNLGRVRSVDRYIDRSDGTTAFYRGRILSPAGEPYVHVYITNGEARTLRRVHRLVAEAFVPNPDNLPQVDHIDCNKLNNCADNLRWCTSADNTHYAWRNGLMHPVPYSERSEWHRERSASANRRPVIRSDGKWYKSTTDAAKDLGVSRGAVSHVLRGLTETCQGYSFTYAERQD